MRDQRSEGIRRSWNTNASAWIGAVREGRIESRVRVTDRAILDAVLVRPPHRVLDLGCGEGWLCRALAERGIDTVGVDAALPLVDAARQAGSGDYRCLPYDVLAAREDLGVFDVVVCNFSLLEEALSPVLNGIRARLADDGRLVIQTVHPRQASRDVPGRDGWRTERFDAIGRGFTERMPWYYRTRAAWIDTLSAHGWQLVSMTEPARPDTGEPVSLLIECVAGAVTEASV